MNAPTWITDLRALRRDGAVAAARALCSARDEGAGAVLVDVDVPPEGPLVVAPAPASADGRHGSLTLDEALALAAGRTLVAARLSGSEGTGSGTRADRVLEVLERAGSPSGVAVIDGDTEVLRVLQTRAPLLTTGLAVAERAPLAGEVERALGCGADLLLTGDPPAAAADLDEAQARGLAVWSTGGHASGRVLPPGAAPPRPASTARAAARTDEPLILVLHLDLERVVAALLHPSRGLEHAAWVLPPEDAEQGDSDAGVADAARAALAELAAESPAPPRAAALVLPSPEAEDGKLVLVRARAAALLTGGSGPSVDPSLSALLGAGGASERPTVGDHGVLPWPAGAPVPVRVLAGLDAAALIGAAGPEGDRLLVYLDRRARVLRGRPAPPESSPESERAAVPLWTAEGRGSPRVLLRRRIVPLPLPERGLLGDPRDERAREWARLVAQESPAMERALAGVSEALHGFAGPRDRAVLVAGPGAAVPQLRHALGRRLALEPLAAEDDADLAWIGAARLAAAAARLPWSFRAPMESLR